MFSVLLNPRTGEESARNRRAIAIELFGKILHRRFMPNPENEAAPSAIEAFGLRVDCGWCKNNIKNPDGDPKQISHGICGSCKAIFFGAQVIEEAANQQLSSVG